MTTTMYQPLERPARLNGTPLISRRDLDALADELMRYPFDPTMEQVWAVTRHIKSWQYMLFPLPNKADNPRDSFVVHKADTRWLATHFDLLGYVHTHRQREDNHCPSEDDLNDLPMGYIGGVYMHGHDNVYWYSMGHVFHETSVLRQALIKQSKDGT